MSIQKQSLRYDISGQLSSATSSIVINRGNEEYNPFIDYEDDNAETRENEQSRETKHQTQETIRINNGINSHPVITKDKAQSYESNEQHSSRHRNSPEHHSKPSDRRSKSPHRKRLRLSPTVTNDSISSSKSKYSTRNDDRKTSKSSYHRHRSSSHSPPSSTSSSDNHKKSSEFKDDKSSDSYRSSKHDDYHSYRSKSSRNSHSDHRTNQSSPTRISSTTSSTTSSSSPSRNDHSNKNSAFNNTNNASQRTRSNLIQIVTTESLSNRSESTTKLPVKSTETKSNSNQADDMLMEEMLLEEEQKQDPIKPIDLDSLTIPESITNKIESKQPSITQSNSTPSPTKKPYYVLHKVPHTNHTTPPRQKKPVNNPPSTDDLSARTSLDDRLSTLFGMPINSSTKAADIQPVSSIQILTPSDKSTESPQDIKSSILTIKKKERESIDEKRSSTSKHYTTEWLATQKPEEAPTEELPSLVSLPTLTSSQPTDTTKTSSNETMMIGKLSELMEKFAQKQTGPTLTNPTETEDAVPISAKHLERIERRKQREKHQSEIAAIAKEALKPAFRKHLITKDEYKQIMKKVVTKATPANEIDRARIGKMIDAYVEKYRLIREHKNCKASTKS